MYNRDFHNGNSYDSRLDGIKFCNSNRTARDTSTEVKERIDMRTLHIILFVVMLLSTIAIGLFSSYAMESLAIASIRIFAISGIIYSLSDLWRLRGSTSV